MCWNKCDAGLKMMPTLPQSLVKTLFGEEIQSEDVIFGEEDIGFFGLNNNSRIDKVEPEVYIHPDFPLDALRETTADLTDIALRLNEIKLIPNKALEYIDSQDIDVPKFLFYALKNNADVINLRRKLFESKGPLKFLDTAKSLFPTLDPEDQRKALYHLVELGSLARQNENSLALIPAKYHLFARAPQGIWTCVNPACPGKEDTKQNWSRIYTMPHRTCEYCGSMVFPIYLCRECGQVFLLSEFAGDESIYHPTSDLPTENIEHRYLTWSQINENTTLIDEEVFDENEIDDGITEPNKIKTVPVQFCLMCGKQMKDCDCQVDQKRPVKLFELNISEVRKRRGVEQSQDKPIKILTTCPRCGYKAKKGTEIATSVTISETAPLANLIYELYRGLPPSKKPNEKKYPGEGRKLLTFYDNRQGAARFAAFLQDVAVNQNYRHIIPKAIEELRKGDEWGEGINPTIVPLSQKCAEMAWEQMVPQNDVESVFWHEWDDGFNAEKRKTASLKMATQILAEFTTKRRNRQSLEQMGFVGVYYEFEEKALGIENLSQKIGLPKAKTTTLINYLLDDLRYAKAIELPNGIYPDDPVFGKNQGHPKIVRQEKSAKDQLRFIGETDRQSRRKYVRLVLASNGFDASENAVKNTLTKIWDWMVGSEGILTGSLLEGLSNS